MAYKSPKTKVTGFFSPIKKAVVNAAATVMSAPVVLSNKRKAAQANADADLIRKARSYDGAPSYEPGVGPTEAGKVRSLAADAKERSMKRVKKLKGK